MDKEIPKAIIVEADEDKDYDYEIVGYEYDDEETQ